MSKDLTNVKTHHLLKAVRQNKQITSTYVAESLGRDVRWLRKAENQDLSDDLFYGSLSRWCSALDLSLEDLGVLHHLRVKETIIRETISNVTDVSPQQNALALLLLYWEDIPAPTKKQLLTQINDTILPHLQVLSSTMMEARYTASNNLKTGQWRFGSED